MAAVACLVAAAFGAILLTGGRDQGSLGVFLAVAGVVLLLVRPRQLPPRGTGMAVVILIGCGALGFLPHSLLQKPAWRRAWDASPAVPRDDMISVVPRETAFWFAILACTVLVGLFVISQPLRSRHLLALAVAMAAAGGLYALLAIFSAETGWTFPFDTESTFGFFPNRNHTATLLILTSIVAIGILGLPGALLHWWERSVAGLTLATCVSALLFYSASRAGVIFLLVGVVAWIAGCGGRRLTKTRLAGFAGAALVVLTLFLALESTAQQRVFTFFGWEESHRGAAKGEAVTPLGQGPDGDVLFDLRLFVYRDAFRLIQDYPLTGSGLGSFPHVFSQYRKSSLALQDAIHPESDWLMLLAEGGAGALLSGGALFFCASRGLFSGRAHRYWPVRWAFVCSALIAVAHGLIDVPAHRISLGWWIVLLGATGLQKAASAASRLPSLSWRIAFKAGGAGALLLGSALLAAEFVGTAPLPPFAASKAAETIDRNFRAGRWEEAVAVADKAIADSPVDDQLYGQLGAILLNFVGQEDEAEEQFAAQRLLQPFSPDVPVAQGEAWLRADPTRVPPLWLEAVERQRRIDERDGVPRALGLFDRLITAATGHDEVQTALLSPAVGTNLLWAGMERSSKAAVAAAVGVLGGDEAFMAGLGIEDRRRFIRFWLRQGSMESLGHFADEHPAWRKELWPVTIRQLIEEHNFSAAVTEVCAQLAISLALPEGDLASVEVNPRGADDPVAEFRRWWQSGNEITARRILKEAKPVGSLSAEIHRHRAALAVHDRQWPAAWSHLERYLLVTKQSLW